MLLSFLCIYLIFFASIIHETDWMLFLFCLVYTIIINVQCWNVTLATHLLNFYVLGNFDLACPSS
jgi:hypothetical protein